MRYLAPLLVPIIAALAVSLIAISTSAHAEPRCIVTRLKVDCGEAGTGMRTDRKGTIWWDDNSVTRPEDLGLKPRENERRERDGSKTQQRR